MSEKLIEELKNSLPLISLDRWKESPSHNSNNLETVRWLPLVKIKPEMSLGLTKEGYWVKDSGGSVTFFPPGTPLVFLLPCLELKYNDLHGMIKAAFLNLGLSGEFFKIFPSSDLVSMGLTIGSGYWSELALNWAEEMNFDDKLKQSLVHARDFGLTQKIRQKASKLLRSYRQSEYYPPA